MAERESLILEFAVDDSRPFGNCPIGLIYTQHRGLCVIREDDGAVIDAFGVLSRPSELGRVWPLRLKSHLQIPTEFNSAHDLVDRLYKLAIDPELLHLLEEIIARLPEKIT